MKALLITPLLLATFISNAWAIGDEKQNGGDVVACDAANPNNFELLDLYEAKTLHQLSLVPAKGTTVETIFEESMQTYESIDPIRASLYRDYMKSFAAEARFVPDSDFTDVPDEGFKAPPKDCTLRQIVVQYDSPAPNGTRYMVNQDLWNHLNEENRAALLIHEFMYREGRKPQNNFRTSSGVRYLNGLIHSTKMKNMTIEEYVREMRAVGFQEIVIQGQPLVLFTWNSDKTQKTPQDIDFHTNGKVAQATLASHFYLPGVSTGEISCRQEIKKEHNISFFASGSVATINIGCENLAYSFHTNGIEGYFSGSSYLYDESGHILQIDADNFKGSNFRYWSSKVHIDGVNFAQPNGISVTLYPNGNPKEVWATSMERWSLQKNINGQWQDFTSVADTIDFNLDGDLQTSAP